MTFWQKLLGQETHAIPLLAAFFSVSAQPDSTAEPIAASGMVFARFDREKMIETYNCVDFVSLFKPLDLLSENTVAMCLSGMKIG
jgi:hypothetical protein